MQKAILKQSVIELYNQFGIYWDTDITTLSNTQFPTFSDLHKLISEKAEKDKSNPVRYSLGRSGLPNRVGRAMYLWFWRT
jgi:hypothetical protein